MARTIVGGDTSALTAPVRFSVHTKSAIGYSVELSPQPGATHDTLILLDLANAGAAGGRAVVDIDLTAFGDVEVPVPTVGEVERTARGLRWTLTLESAEKAQLQIPATSGDEPAFPVDRCSMRQAVTPVQALSGSDGLNRRDGLRVRATSCT